MGTRSCPAHPVRSTTLPHGGTRRSLEYTARQVTHSPSTWGHVPLSPQDRQEAGAQTGLGPCLLGACSPPWHTGLGAGPAGLPSALAAGPWAALRMLTWAPTSRRSLQQPCKGRGISGSRSGLSGVQTPRSPHGLHQPLGMAGPCARLGSHVGPQDCLSQQASCRAPSPGPTLWHPAPGHPGPAPSTPQGSPPASHTGSAGTPWASPSALSLPGEPTGEPTFPSEGSSLFPLQRAGQTGCPPDT